MFIQVEPFGRWVTRLDMAGVCLVIMVLKNGPNEINSQGKQRPWLCNDYVQAGASKRFCQ